ncbi:hypothetical protein Cni_G14938 [Canna indica]|uniref:Uncharacterized protein n=1 Tax=Canna indica TaxID=4628 RepID=A0AAQ3KIP0_9LILI|nr:hypothetical protein Cni_G14938 [Canna indica]
MQQRMKKAYLLLLLVFTMVLRSSGRQLISHEDDKMDRGEMKATTTLGYSEGSSNLDNHHSIPRDLYNSRIGGSTQQPPYGDDGSNQGGNGN